MNTDNLECELYICGGTGELSAKLSDDPTGRAAPFIGTPIVTAAGIPSLAKDDHCPQFIVHGKLLKVPCSKVSLTGDAQKVLPQELLEMILRSKAKRHVDRVHRAERRDAVVRG